MTVKRGSDSSLIVGVSQHTYRGETGVATPDCCWDLLVINDGDKTHAILTGAITRPVLLAFPAGTEVVSITFQPHAFLPHMPAIGMLNAGLELPKAGKNKIWLGSEAIEIPTFENAEAFVEKLNRHGLIKNDTLVGSFLAGDRFAASERSVQRHFLQATGMTMKFMQQVQRAQLAVEMLQKGERIVDVAHALGYTDQAHMTKSLKGIMGVTPRAIIEAA